MTGSLARRATAEGIGTAALVAVVVGSGIQAAALSHDVGVQLLANALATVFALAVLIAVLGPVSGAHFNPVVTLVTWLTGRRRPERSLTGRDAAAYVPAQIVGAIGGAGLANAMFAGPVVEFSHHDRFAGHLWLGELVATTGLLFTLLGLARAGRTGLAPALVPAYIGAAYWFTSSTSFANPAVTIGRAFTDTFSGIAPSSVPPFIAAQLAGAVLGIALTAVVFGRPATTATPAAAGAEPSLTAAAR
ncbi:aquaporin [Streptomyces sp. NPDC059564]|uniref:aquaporin n=1 Tax=Streptomyces sp. NPDC059564 TaxID=3346865 RepID=UPI003687A220